MILAGDVGGTKTSLGLFSRAPRRPLPLATLSFPTLDFPSLGAIVSEFLRARREQASRIEAASFGVAGPVIGRRAELTNVPWSVDADEVATACGLERVSLLNDLEAMAYSVPVLEPTELAVLQQGEPLPTGNAALIAAGTGLGMALLHNVDGRWAPFASEGGHADFAARTPRELALVAELTGRYGRAHCEHVVSGPGVLNIHRFLHRNGCPALPSGVDPTEAPAVISAAALERRCEVCVETLELFVSAYGAAAGNLALASVATAGLYVGGGIAPKILPLLTRGGFIEAFRAKEPMADLMARIPVNVILNEDAGLLGAAVHANE